jgi:hypothetical protein
MRAAALKCNEVRTVMYHLFVRAIFEKHMKF